MHGLPSNFDQGPIFSDQTKTTNLMPDIHRQDTLLRILLFIACLFDMEFTKFFCLAFAAGWSCFKTNRDGYGINGRPVATGPASNGQGIWAIGTSMALDLGQSISKGIVSGKRKVEECRFLPTDVSASPGSSGGPLIDQEFEVIGNVSNKISFGGAEGLGFAISIGDLLKALNVTLK